jgi:hypothetical protein
MKRIAVVAIGAVLLTTVAMGADQGLPAAGFHQAVNARWALDEVVPDVNVDAIGIDRVIDFLRNVSGANIVVDWNTLTGAGVAKDAPVTLQVRGLTLRKVLQLALDQASPNTAMTMSVDQNVIEVTTQEAADRKLVTRTYSVADLVLPPVTSTPPTLSLTQATQQGSSGGGGGSGLFTDTNSQQTQQTSQQRADQLVMLIKTMVRPTIWQDNGGTASISYFIGQLVVTAPMSVHETIGGSPESSGERYGF